MEQLLEVEVSDWDEYTSISIAVLAVLRALHGEDPETEKYRSGQRIIDGLVARTFEKGNPDARTN